MKKKLENENKKTEEAVAENAETVAESTDYEEIIRKSEEKADEYLNMAKRVQAEFDNYRKRNAESVKAARDDGINEMLLAMIDISDTVEQALKMIKDEATKKGVELIYKKIASVLEKYDVKEIDAEGAEFNPELHNAVIRGDSEEDVGKIAEVYQKGYVRGSGKVLRYATVKVG